MYNLISYNTYNTIFMVYIIFNPKIIVIHYLGIYLIRCKSYIIPIKFRIRVGKYYTFGMCIIPTAGPVLGISLHMVL